MTCRCGAHFEWSSAKPVNKAFRYRTYRYARMAPAKLKKGAEVVGTAVVVVVAVPVAVAGAAAGAAVVAAGGLIYMSGGLTLLLIFGGGAQTTGPKRTTFDTRLNVRTTRYRAVEYCSRGARIDRHARGPATQERGRRYTWHLQHCCNTHAV